MAFARDRNARPAFPEYHYNEEEENDAYAQLNGRQRGQSAAKRSSRLPHSRGSSRPPSAHANHPPSAHANRPPSSHTNRPPSAHGSRPPSSHAKRPPSSHANRPPSRQGPAVTAAARPKSASGCRPSSGAASQPPEHTSFDQDAAYLTSWRNPYSGTYMRQSAIHPRDDPKTNLKFMTHGRGVSKNKTADNSTEAQRAPTAFAWMETVKPDLDCVKNLVQPYGDERLRAVLQTRAGAAQHWPAPWLAGKDESVGKLIGQWDYNNGPARQHPRFRTKELSMKIVGDASKRHFTNEFRKSKKFANRLTGKPNHNEFDIRKRTSVPRPITTANTPTLVNILQFEGEENKFYD